MTNFFEYQRIAKQKSQRVLVAFVAFMLFLLFVFNGVVYLIFSYTHYTDPAPSISHSVYTQPLEPKQTGLQKALLIHPQTASIQWAMMVIFLALFVGGFLYRLFHYRAFPLSVVHSMVHKQLHPSGNLSGAERQLLNIVEEMCIASGIPVVKTFVLTKEEAINAFTAGHDLRTAYIAVTQGAVDHFSRDEMQAVVAHEIGHIVSADVKVNSLLLSCIFSMTFIMMAGRALIQSSGSSSRRSNRSSGGGGGAGQAALLALALICIGALGALCGRILQSLFSRKREFLADSLAAQFTRNPSALASALAKIRDLSYIKMSNIIAPDISHMCIASTLQTDLFGLFATHPPVDERIALLDKKHLKVHPVVHDLINSEIRKKDEATTSHKRKLELPLDHLGPLMAVYRIPEDRELNFDPYEAFLEGERLLGRLQKQSVIQDVLHKPQEFKYAVWGLFLASEPAIKSKQIEALKKHYGQELDLALLEQSVLKTGDHTELANSVMSIALAQAQNLELQARQRFLNSLQNLMIADGVIEPFEHIIYACFQAQQLRRPERARIQLEHVRSLIFMSAQLNLTSETSTLDIYRQALQKYMGIHATYVSAPPKAMELGDTIALLQQLRWKSIQTRQEVLMAIRFAICADQKVCPKEYEAFRAISMALDIPAPPINL